MTTIPQLPQAVSVDTLQSGLQPKLTFAHGALLGRVSPPPGQPEPVGIGRINTQGDKIRVAGTLDISAAGAAAIDALPGSGAAPSGATGGRGNL
jgi:hypothetical protein